MPLSTWYPNACGELSTSTVERRSRPSTVRSLRKLPSTLRHESRKRRYLTRRPRGSSRSSSFSAYTFWLAVNTVTSYLLAHHSRKWSRYGRLRTNTSYVWPLNSTGNVRSASSIGSTLQCTRVSSRSSTSDRRGPERDLRGSTSSRAVGTTSSYRGRHLMKRYGLNSSYSSYSPSSAAAPPCAPMSLSSSLRPLSGVAHAARSRRTDAPPSYSSASTSSAVRLRAYSVGDASEHCAMAPPAAGVCDTACREDGGVTDAGVRVELPDDSVDGVSAASFTLDSSAPHLRSGEKSADSPQMPPSAAPAASTKLPPSFAPPLAPPAPAPPPNPYPDGSFDARASPVRRRVARGGFIGDSSDGSGGASPASYPVRTRGAARRGRCGVDAIGDAGFA
mmetsp:Transcript_19253/g.67998  ORF Transcript_19253/g.67998 Transcript_19253/m.67998 type:complete len:391 (-) Transcript_19253:713-1885(-)